MLFERTATHTLARLLRQYPTVALVGPRQAGKTTLAKMLGGEYFDLERDEHRLRLDLQWPELAAGSTLVVLDEAQTWPDIFLRLRGAIDDDRKRNRRFLLLGSVSPALMKEVSQSLAGRLAMCELGPLAVEEIGHARTDDLWLCGGFPDGGIVDRASFPDWQRYYLELLASRDLPNWGLPAAPQNTQRLFKMLAARHSAMLNLSELGKSLGLNYHTVGSYLDYMAGAYLVRKLPPLHVNITKRLVRTPKVYWRDSGLVHSMLGVSAIDQLLNQPWVGSSWEGFVIEQILLALAARGTSCEPSFLRTSDGIEIDLVIDIDGKRWAVEVKLTTAPSNTDMIRLNKAADIAEAEYRVLVSRTTESLTSHNTTSTNLKGVLKLLRESGTGDPMPRVAAVVSN